MNRCAFCHGKFGLVRHESHGHQFCSARCKHDYQKQRQEQSRVSQFLRWVRPGSAAERDPVKR